MCLCLAIKEEGRRGDEFIILESVFSFELKKHFVHNSSRTSQNLICIASMSSKLFSTWTPMSSRHFNVVYCSVSVDVRAVLKVEIQGGFLNHLLRTLG